MTLVLVLAVAVLIVVLLIRYEEHRREKAIESAFSGRDRHSTEEFYERYFKTQGIPEYVVSGIKRILEEHLSADLSRLTAEDDFSENLSFFWGFDSMADVEVLMALEEKFEIRIEAKEVERASTVSGIVNLVWGKVSEEA